MAENKNGGKKRHNVNSKLPFNGKTALRYNIGVRFFSFVVLVALLSGGVVGFVMIKNSRDYLRQQALQSNLNQANLAASYASNYIAAVEAHIKVFATRPDVVQAVLNGQASQLQPTLAAFVQIQTPLSGVGIYDLAGIQLTYSLSNTTTIGQSFSARNWFQGVTSAGQPYLGTPLLSAGRNIPVETFAVPILDDHGTIRAVLAAGISLTQLSNALVNIGFNTDTQAVLIDTRNGGSIIADNNTAFLLTVPVADTLAVNQLLTGKSGSLVTTGSNGKQDLTGFAAVPGLPWGIMVVTPGSAAFSILTSLTERSIIYALLIVLLSGVFGVILVLGITRPLNRLMQDIKEIGSGNLDVKLETTGKDEIGDLSRAFSEMVAKLKITMVSRDALAKEAVERKKAEEALKASETRLRAILDATPFPVALVDSQDNNIYFWSRSALTLFGHTAPTAPEWYLLAYPDPDYRQQVIGRWKPFLEKARLSGQPVNTGEYRVSCRDSSVRICELYATFIADWLIVTFNDITERKLLEQEKEKFTRELAEKNTELERFTYTVSHDLKSPLVTIKTFLGYLKNDIGASDSERVDKDMLFMNTAADKMGLLLQELLEMSRIGRIVNPSVESSSTEIIKEAVGILAGPIADRGVQIQVSGESVTLYGDRSRLLEIWQNLLENAVKFMGDQPSPQIEIGVEQQNSETVFFVRDNGIGIEPQYQSKIFNLFEKIDAKTDGTGMGLAIVKRIVELYQGKIWVESKGTGQGTVFFFTLPGALANRDNGGKE